MQESYYSINKPYPEINVNMPDFRDVRCLINDYAGFCSETTAIFSYIYQSFVLADSYPDIAKALEGIAIVEMHHLSMLGHTIERLHGDPKFSGLNGFWNGAYVNYNKNVKAILQKDIKDEQLAIADYRRTIKCLTNNSIKELIERIIQDEELHIKILQELLDSVN